MRFNPMLDLENEPLNERGRLNSRKLKAAAAAAASRNSGSVAYANPYQNPQSVANFPREQIVARGDIGIENNRNDCYLISSLQCLLSTDELVEYFLDNRYAELGS